MQKIYEKFNLWLNIQIKWNTLNTYPNGGRGGYNRTAALSLYLIDVFDLMLVLV